MNTLEALTQIAAFCTAIASIIGLLIVLFRGLSLYNDFITKVKRVQKRQSLIAESLIHCLSISLPYQVGEDATLTVYHKERLLEEFSLTNERSQGLIH